MAKLTLRENLSVEDIMDEFGNMEGAQIVQGDILLKPAVKEDVLRYGLSRVGLRDRRLAFVISDAPDNLTLGYGEQTGHAHVLVGARWLVEACDEIVADAEKALYNFATFGELKSTAYVYVPEDTQLAHVDESGNPTIDHTPLPVKAGLYEVIRQTISIDDAITPVLD